jgi:hypothetical protein
MIFMLKQEHERLRRCVHANRNNLLLILIPDNGNGNERQKAAAKGFSSVFPPLLSCYQQT